jgi:CRISPR/Cas system-associated endoribonuclease Cas2
MAVFLISYDLRKPDFDYDPLYDALAKIKAKHIQDSVWGVNVNDTAKSVFNYLWQHMHNEKDRLFVVPFDKKEEYKADNSINKLNSI